MHLITLRPPKNKRLDTNEEDEAPTSVQATEKPTDPKNEPSAQKSADTHKKTEDAEDIAREQFEVCGMPDLQHND